MYGISRLIYVMNQVNCKHPNKTSPVALRKMVKILIMYCRQSMDKKYNLEFLIASKDKKGYFSPK